MARDRAAKEDLLPARRGAGPVGGPLPPPRVPSALRGPPGPRAVASPPDAGEGGARPAVLGERIDFHSHTFLSDGACSPLDMWYHALQIGHKALAITDHYYAGDPVPMIDRLLAEQEMFHVTGFTTLVGVEISMNPPEKIAESARRCRKAGAQIVIVHGETPVEPVPLGTNHASLDSNEVDVLAHPGLLTEEDAALAQAHNVALELTPRRGHSWGNGLVALRALQAGAELVVDSDAHDADQLLRQEMARRVALGAGVSPDRVERILSEAPARLLKRLSRG